MKKFYVSRGEVFLLPTVCDATSFLLIRYVLFQHTGRTGRRFQIPEPDPGVAIARMEQRGTDEDHVRLVNSSVI